MPAIQLTPTTLVDSFVRIQASRLESNPAMLWWSGVAVLSAALGRGVVTRILGPKGPALHTALFIVLVGEANSGKSVAVRSARDTLDALYIRQAADSTPPEAFHTWLSQATAKCVEEGRDTGVFLALESMDSFFDRRIPRSLKALLNAAYDCAPRFTRNTIKHKAQPLDRLCLNILAAGTPAHIGSCFGADDWIDGLASRFLFVAGGEPRAGGCLPWDDDLADRFQRSMVALRAEVDSLAVPIEIKWTEEAWAAQATWRAAPAPARPHPHASGYWSRRHTSACKLACVLAVSAHGHVEDAVIDLGAWEAALEALAEIESGLSYCLTHTGANPYAAVQTRLLEWAAHSGRPVREQEIRRHLWQFVPPQYIDACIEQLVTAGLLIPQSGSSHISPNRLFLHHQLQPSASWQAIRNAQPPAPNSQPSTSPSAPSQTASPPVP